MTYYSILKTSLLGDLLLVANPTHLTGIYFYDRQHSPVVQSDWKLAPQHAVLKQTRKQLQDYLKNVNKKISVPVHFSGTDFQQRVWQEIAKIPFGQTITYSELAARVGAPEAIRAAGTATGKNPLSIVIPCHRVVGKNTTLRGYAGGLERKRHLLELEGNTQNLDLRVNS